jgi:hypothetical protein
MADKRVHQRPNYIDQLGKPDVHTRKIVVNTHNYYPKVLIKPLFPDIWQINEYQFTN